MISEKRKTIMREVKYKGIGLHKGENIDLKLLPAPCFTGIVFRRTDIKDVKNEILLCTDNVFSPNRGTNIRNEHGVEIFTVEHFLSALYVYGITDLFVEISGNELPIGDGSAFPFVELIDIAGTREFKEKADIYEITEPVYIADEDKYIIALPHPEYKITYAVNYNHSYLKSFLAEFEITKENFKNEIAKSRTFGFDYEVEYLRANGLALGGTLDNAIVVAKNGVLNPDGLRYEDEFVRHKILDLIGDFKVMNKIIKGHIIAVKSGHSLNSRFTRKLLELKNI